jgi:hypothetical protein
VAAARAQKLRAILIGLEAFEALPSRNVSSLDALDKGQQPPREKSHAGVRSTQT